MSGEESVPELEKIESPGEVLREARQKYGLSEEDVAAELNLSVNQIRALEDDNFQDLPGETYARGYLKSYARLLNADEGRVLKDFSQQGNTAITGIQPVMRETRSSDRHMKLLSLAVIALLSGLMFMWWQGREELNVIPLNVGESVEEDVVAEDDEDAPSSEGVVQNEDGALLTQTEQGIEVAPASGAGSDTANAQSDVQSLTVDIQTGAGQEVVAETGTDIPDSATSDSTVSAEDAEPAAPTQSRNEIATAAEVETGSGDQQAAAVRRTAAVSGTGGDAPAGDAVEAVDSGQEVRLTFTVASWVDLRDAEGRRLLYKNVDEGQKVSVRGQPPFSVFLGNAEGVQVEYQGQPFDFTAFTNGIYARFELGAAHTN